ncbi:MAG: type II glyceraldehyde-3-phosphate dehydrogenase, partial [Candidatus Omnitrophota bacterium]
MFGEAPRLLCIRKTIAVITIAQFVLSSPAVIFAAGDNLRPAAAKNSPRVYDVRNAFKKDGGTASTRTGGFINVQSNMAGLYRGAQTGGMNTYHAYEQGSNGNLLDHSENRERLEGAVKDMVVSLTALRNASLDALSRYTAGSPKGYNVIVSEIESDSTLTADQKKTRLAEAKADVLAAGERFQKNTADAVQKLEEEYFLSTKAQMSRIERATGLNADNQKLVLSWVRAYYSAPKGGEEEALGELVAKITNRVKNQELLADVAFGKKYYEQYGAYPYSVTTLCLGEKKSQYDAQDPKKAWKILDRDLRQMLEGVTLADSQMLGLRLAYEPRWIIGADTIPVDVLAKIDDTHAFIKEVSDELLGQELMVDYGAAVKEGTIESIMKLPHVDGVLIGSAANDPATLKPVVFKAAEYAARTGKVFNLGVNWKASDSTSGLKDLSAFIALFKSMENLDKISVTIATPNVREARTAMDKVENYFSKVSLTALGATVNKLIDLGNGLTVDGLVQTEKGEAAIRGFFGEDTGINDSYRILRKDGIAFALAKDNGVDQTFMAVPVDDISAADARDAYYANLLEAMSLLTARHTMGLELIVHDGDLLKRYLASSIQPKAKQESFDLGNLVGKKNWYGRERFLQIEYAPENAAADIRPTLLTVKNTERVLGHGVSFIIQPKYTVLVNGYGTIGAKAATAARKAGFFIMATARSIKIDSRDAFLKDYPLVLSDTKNAADFEKQGMNVAGALLDVLPAVDVVIDATPAKVGAQNLKDIYSKFPGLRVIFEGGEKAGEGIQSFSSRTNFDAVRNSKVVRVVSCNTTAMSRLYGALAEAFDGLVIDNLAMRRAADPGDEKGENPDGVSVVPAYHHGPDLRTVLSEFANAHIVGLNTDAAVTPTTHFHVHQGTIRGPGLTVANVQELFKAQSRVALIEFPGGELKTAVLFDIFNSMIPDANHPFIIPVQVKASSIPGEIKITFAVPQESNVVPENVNALQSMFGLFQKDAAIRLVNEVLNIEKIKDGLEKRLPAQIKKDGGVEEVKIPMDYLTLDDVDASGRTVLYRGDFNSPVENGKLRITERMRANAVTLKELHQKGAKVVIMVHQGRKGDADYLESLQQYAGLVSELIGAPAGYVDDLYGPDAVNAIQKMKNSDVLVLKNVRSWDAETEKKMTLEQQAQSAMVQALQP